MKREGLNYTIYPTFVGVKKNLFLFLFATTCSLWAQEQPLHELDANVFYGSILIHNKDISHLVTGHPTGFILSYNRKTYGLNAWESRYNYPDWGFSFAYQDMKNEELGDNYGVYG